MISRFVYRWIVQAIEQGQPLTLLNEDGAAMLRSPALGIALSDVPELAGTPCIAIERQEQYLLEPVTVLCKRDFVKGVWSYKVRFASGTTSFIPQTSIINAPLSRDVEAGW